MVAVLHRPACLAWSTSPVYTRQAMLLQSPTRSTNAQQLHCNVQVKSALQAVSRLHNRVLEPDKGAGKDKKAGASAGTLMWARQVSGEGLHMKKWRLIIRNLAFDVRPLGALMHQLMQGACHCAVSGRGFSGQLA